MVQGKPNRLANRSTYRNNAFTLIELLVVISIIALLLSILMPALSLAKQHAEVVICKTRLKTVFTAESLFAAENDDLISPFGPDMGPMALSPPINGDKISHAVNLPYWNYRHRLMPYIDQDFEMGDDLSRAMERADFPFMCPSAVKRVKVKYVKQGNFMYMASIGRNEWLGLRWDDTKNRYSRRNRLDKFGTSRSSAETVYNADAACYLGFENPEDGRFAERIAGHYYHLPLFFHFGKDFKMLVDPNIYAAGRSTVCEDGKTTVTFLDGHVENRKANQWIMESKKIDAGVWPLMEEAGMTSNNCDVFWRGGFALY